MKFRIKTLLIAVGCLLAAACIVLPVSWYLASATVSEVTARHDFTGNGSTTDFTFSFPIYVKGDIEVLLDGTVKILDTNYQVRSGALLFEALAASSLPATGFVRFIDAQGVAQAPITNAKILLLRKQAKAQLSDYVLNEPFPAGRLERDLDKLAMILQQAQETLGRALKFEKKSLTKDKDVPDFSAGKFLKVTDAGTALEWVSPVTVGTLNTPSFTTGSIPFATGTATLGQDNPNLFWDDVNNRLGIGTATPSTQLHATGTATLPTIAGPTTYTGTHTIPTIAGPTSTTGTWTFGGTATSTKACATGYVRQSPNFCVDSTASSAFISPWSDAVACTQRTFSGNALPSDAKAVRLTVLFRALSNNTTGIRSNSVGAFLDPACGGTNSGQIIYSTYEHVAVAVGSNIGESDFEILAPLCATNTICTTQTNAGGNGNSDVQSARIAGYFD